MQRKGNFGNIFIISLICLIVISSVSLDTVFSYFSDKTGTEGNTTMGYIELVSLTNLDGSEMGDAQTLDSDQTFTGEYKLVTNTNINYYVYIFLKGTITPDGDKTHDSGCGDYYADDTDCLDITVNGYSKLDIKSDGYTIYYKLCTIQTAGQNTQTFSISASIKTDLVENGCDYYDNATILFDMKVKTKQADYLQANEYTLGFSSPLVNKDLCSIGFIVPIQDVSKYPNLTFTVTDSNAKTMSVAAADTSITTANIPSQVEMNGEIYTITSIPDNAFRGCVNLTSVTISEGVTSLESFSFYGCASLTSVTLPSSLTSIEAMSFYGCSSLTSITLPDSVTSIGRMSFQNCTSLTSVDIPEGVTYLEYNTFSGCTSLTSITLPSSLTGVGSMAFSGCTSLTSVIILNGDISIDETIFAECNIRYNIYDNAKYLGNDDNPYLVLMGATSTSITSCEIHPNCKSITGSGFKNCTNLTSITIPSSVTSIKYYNFSGCTSLTAINVDSGNTTYSSIDGVVFSKDATELVLCPIGKTGSYTIPNSVTSIGSSAFYGCTGLTSVTLTNGLTSIGSSAFYNCTGLTSITIPSSVASIGDYAFSGCSNLQYNTYGNAKYLGNSTNPYLVLVKATSTSITSCTINSNCKLIYCRAFYSCSTWLRSITIPSSVTSIGGYAFGNCTNLTSVTFENTTGWHLDSTVGTSIDVTDASTNATNLKSSSGAWYNQSLYRA